MNRAQKKAWFGLAGFLFSDLLLGVYFLVMQIPRGTPERGVLGFGTTGAGLAVLGILLWRFRRKQSAAEPEADERDRAIIRKAVVVSFVSVWVMLVAATCVPILMLGADGAVPVAVLPVFHLGIFMAAMTIYFAAVVVQYRIDGDIL